jgi:SP family xylose:H+ symportor-like MFS transporter
MPTTAVPRPSALLLRSTAVAALGSLLFGFDTAVISGTTTALEQEYALTPSALGFTVASALIGTILGSVLAGKPADRFGRRGVLLMIAVLYFVSAVGCAVAWDWPSLLCFRFIGGIGVGGASVVAPLYITEIAPARYRGRLVAFTQFNIVLGILLAFFSNYLIARLGLGGTAWRWMFGVEALPAAAFFLLLFFTPHSPRWLVLRGLTDEAAVVLQRLGTDHGQVSAEIAAIEASLGRASDLPAEPLFRRAYRGPIFLTAAIAVFNQLSGINAVMYYAPAIFRMAGAGEDASLLQAVAVGGVNLIFTMLAMSIIDHFGRRRLMIVGSVGYVVSLSMTAWAFQHDGERFSSSGSALVLAGLLLFIASHAFGQGAVIWVFIGEIFPNRVRARGQALGSFIHWAMAAAVAWTFPAFAARFGGGFTFALYAVMMVLQLAWVLAFMPETRGVSLEEIQRRLGIE